MGNTCSPLLLAIFPADNFGFVFWWFGSRIPNWEMGPRTGLDRTGRAGPAIAVRLGPDPARFRGQSPIFSLFPSAPAHQHIRPRLPGSGQNGTRTKTRALTLSARRRKSPGRRYFPCPGDPWTHGGPWPARARRFYVRRAGRDLVPEAIIICSTAWRICSWLRFSPEVSSRTAPST